LTVGNVLLTTTKDPKKYIPNDLISLPSQDRKIALKRMSQAGAFLTTAQSAAFMLMQTADHENFKTVSKLTVEHMKLPNEFNGV